VPAICAITLCMNSLPNQKPDGFLAEPPSKEGPGVLVLHPWWGLNADVKAICKRLADEGFVAFALDLFHGKVATTIPEAEALMKEHDAKHKELSAQIADAIQWLAAKTSKDISVVGFSFGAFYALELSNEDPEHIRKVVVFYGTGHEAFGKSKANYQGHFAGNDPYEPKEGVDALAKLLKEAGRPASIYTYPGAGHWFFEPSRKDAYNEQAAELAWKRTIEFLK
jgi:carboxymethylenebutenolidase